MGETKIYFIVLEAINDVTASKATLRRSVHKESKPVQSNCLYKQIHPTPLTRTVY
jgi:hypothetical protein